MTDRDLRELLRFAHQLLDETDAIVTRHAVTDLHVERKPDMTLVSAADLEVEAHLRERITKRFSNHGFLGEEHGEDRGDGETRWIVDPIDGTHNFIRGIDVYATLLAVEREGRLVLGAVSAPALGRRWAAATGLGASLRTAGGERPIHVSRVSRLADAQLCTSGWRQLADGGLLPGWQRAVGRAWRDRGFGDFWGHMLVAQGAAEAMVEHGVKPWDLAAPAAIVVEAGGRMTDLQGRDSWNGPGALTTNRALHDELLQTLLDS
ncbi:MAG TPA: inositol monophosphatase family protein [candidate division Zixibacteria bacterium]|nr:inositol monophosphatase family protein [candidate division Zixibacteria bacterium]